MERRKIAMDYTIGGLAAVGAGFFTNPLEVVKTRMQLQGELSAKGQYTVHYKNIFSASYMIAKHDGILSLQAGLVPALWFQLVLNGTRLGTYQLLTDHGYTTDKTGKIVFYKSVIAGGVCGVLGGLTGSPLYLVKTHLQAQAAKEISFGHQHHHEGTWKAFKNIYSTQGVKGLFRGSTSSIPRAFVGSTAQLTSFDYCKAWLNKYPIFKNSPLLTTFCASMIGGVTISIFMTPFDLVSTRMYNQGVDSSGKGLLYSNYFDCVIKIWKSEGFMGFYKGIGPSYFRLGVASVGAEFFTNPLEVVKTRMQLQDELLSKGKKPTAGTNNLFSAIYTIYKKEGIWAFQVGLAPSLLYQLILNGTRLGMFQTLNDRGFTRDQDGQIVFYKYVISGGVCGVFGAYAGSPIYLVKTLMQGKEQSNEKAYKMFLNIYNAQGLKGLFKGSTTAIPRAFVGSTSQLTSFGQCKEWLKNYETFKNSPLLLSFVASMVGGVAMSIFMNPFDLVSTRMYNQDVDSRGKGLLYDNYLDCVKKTWKTEGLVGFYKGVGASYARLGPHTVLCLVFWDKLKELNEKFRNAS